MAKIEIVFSKAAELGDGQMRIESVVTWDRLEELGGDAFRLGIIGLAQAATQTCSGAAEACERIIAICRESDGVQAEIGAFKRETIQ